MENEAVEKKRVLNRKVKISKYRVWYSPKDEAGKKSIEVEAQTLKQAKIMVSEMFAGCRVTQAWLLEK